MQTEEIKEFEEINENREYKRKYFSKPYRKGELRAVYTMSLANYLIDKGYEVKRVSTNKLDKNSVVFFFDNTDELEFYIRIFLAEYLNTNE